VKQLLTYLSFYGRTNRARFWLAALSVWGIIVVGAFIGMGLGGLAPLASLLLLPVFVLGVVAAVANYVRRLHDRNKSAWWLVVFLGVPAFFSVFGALGAAGGGPSDAANFISALGLPFSIWGLVEMGFLRGSRGPNKYGDDPLQPAAEVFA
jgi:uncharacterized membrane protein YhaH (DUF805 family)